MRTQTRWRVLVVVALAVVAAGQRWGSLATTARADTGLAITADQPLIPAFNRSVHDYAVRCSGAPDVVSVNAPDGVEVSVDHATLRSGSFSRSVPLDTGQEFSFSVRQSGATERYYARCLPSDFPTYTYSQDRAVSPGMFVVDGIGTYLAVFDTDGVPLWWMKRSMRPFDSQILTDGQSVSLTLGR